jgi:hypothetical protein
MERQCIVAHASLDSGGAFLLYTIQKLRATMVKGELFGQLVNFLEHPLEGYIAQLNISLNRGAPSTSNISVISREPDFHDIIILGILDDTVIIMSEECGLKLQATLIDRNCMTDMVCSWSIDWEIFLPGERNFEDTD